MARKAFGIYAFAASLFLAGLLVLPSGSLSYSIWYLCAGISCGAAILIGARLNQTAAPRAWHLIALGQLLVVAADGASLAFERVEALASTEWSADIFRLAAYPAVGAGLLLMIRARSPRRDTSNLIDVAIVSTGMAFYSWIFLIEPYVGDSNLGLYEKVVAAFYPMMDIALVAVAARILIGSGMQFVSVSLVGSALLLQLAGDGFYLTGSMQGRHVDGSAIDLILVAAFCVWGLAALHPSMANITERTDALTDALTRRRLAVLTLAALVTPILMLEQSVRMADVGVFMMFVASSTLFCLVIARFAGVVKHHDRAKMREAYLRRAAGALVATRRRPGIYRVAVDTALALSVADGATATSTVLSLGDPADMTVVEVSGSQASDLVGCRFENLPAAVLEALERGQVSFVRGPAAVGSGLLAGERLTLYPILIRGTGRGSLSVQTDGFPDSSQQQALQTLAAQVGLAIESAEFAEEAVGRESERRFRRLVQNSTDVIVVVEPDLTIRFATPSTKTILGYDSDELVGTSLAALLEPGSIDDALALVSALGEHAVTRDLEIRRADGGQCAVESVWTDMSDDADVGGIVITAHDVTQRRELESQLTHQAFHDPLTGLANRALFTDRVAHALDRTARSGEQLAVLFVDLDDFKTVNDSLGHAAGDDLLVAVAARLNECLRGGDTCARLGGDEFGVLIEGVRPPETAEDVAERIAEALEKPFAAAGNEVYARASIGVALGATATGVGELLRHADVAMYRAKNDPGKTIEVFEPGMQDAAVQRLELRGDLERAVADAMLAVHYQPIVALETGRVVGLEALVRWEHATRGLLGPDTFVPLAEETGLIGRIGAIVLDHACTGCRRLATRRRRRRATAAQCQPLGTPAQRREVPLRTGRRARTLGPASRRPDARADRERPDGGRREIGASAAAAEGTRGQHRDRRLRDGILVPELSASVPGRLAEDPETVRRAGGPGRVRQARGGDHESREVTPARDRGGGNRGRRTAERPPNARLHPRAGVLLLAADVRGRDTRVSGAAPPGRRLTIGPSPSRRAQVGPASTGPRRGAGRRDGRARAPAPCREPRRRVPHGSRMRCRSVPIAGPPVHWPTASAWFVIESTVARTPDSSTFRLSHVWKIGSARLRPRPTAKNAARAGQNCPARPKTSALRRSEAWIQKSAVAIVVEPDVLRAACRADARRRSTRTMVPAPKTPNQTTGRGRRATGGRRRG